MKEYTVVLKLPDYITGGDDQYFTTSVKARTSRHALSLARSEACLKVDGISFKTDLASVAVFLGDHNNISPE